jgi:hypothetical protein
MILYGSSLSPFVRKVLAYAAEKGIELEVTPVAPGDPNPDFRAASPFGKMPALRDGAFGLADSSAIIHYLEAKFPQPAMIPAEPRARGKAIWFEEFADTILISCGAKIFFNLIVAPRFLGRPGGRRGARAFDILDDLWLAAFHDGDAAVGRAQVDANDLGHILYPSFFSPSSAPLGGSRNVDFVEDIGGGSGATRERGTEHKGGFAKRIRPCVERCREPACGSPHANPSDVTRFTRVTPPLLRASPCRRSRGSSGR